MKKILGLLAIVLGLTGCSTPVTPVNVAPVIEEETYIVEVGVVSNDTADIAFEMIENISGEVSLSDIFAIRDYLYAKTATNDYEIVRNVTFEELKSALVQVSHTEGSEIANGIKECGSYLGIFDHRNYSYKKIWICITKTGLLY